MLKKLKRAGVWALALSIAVTMTPATAFATDGGDSPGASDPAGSEQLVQMEEDGVSAQDDPTEIVTFDSLADCFETDVRPDYENEFVMDNCYRGLVRAYGEDWPTGDPSPKLAVKEAAGLTEGEDYKREYAFFKGTFLRGFEGFFEGNNDAGLKFEPDADDMNDVGYIMERITGLNEKYEEQTIYALHLTVVDVKYKADDMYKTLSNDPFEPSADPVFTATMTVGDYPDEEELTSLLENGTGLGNYINIVREPLRRLSDEKTTDPVTLYPVLDPESENAYCKFVGSEEFSYENTEEGVSFVFSKAPEDCEGEEFLDYYDFYQPPVRLTLIPGTLYIDENNQPLPASQYRVAKQLEAENLVQGEDGKYTTKIKMTLPVVDGVDPEDYYFKHDLGFGEFDEENNYDDDYGDDDYDDELFGEGSVNALKDTYRHPDPARKSKQNDTLYRDTAVYFGLSPDFNLPLDKDGKLDISSLKLVFHAFQFLEEGEEYDNTDFSDEYLEKVVNTRPEMDKDGYVSYDFVGYKLGDCVFGEDEDDEDDGDEENCQEFGFGLILDYDDDDDDDILESDATSDNEYGSDDFMFVVDYLPEGIGSDELKETEGSDGSEEFDDFSLLEGPALVVSFCGGEDFGVGENCLNPLQYFTFAFVEELASPSTTPGTYGSYDPYGKDEGTAIKVLDKATLLRYGKRQDNDSIQVRPVPLPAQVISDEGVSAAGEGRPEMEKPEEFYIPTVSYTVKDNGNNNTGGGGRSGGRATVTVPEPEVPLAELPELNKKDHVAYVIGYEDGTVRPENYITRAEVSTIFFRLLTDDSRKAIWSSSNSYKDTVATAWYNNAVSTLSNGGVLSGYTDGTFLPSGNITRAEFATIAARFDESVVDTNSVSFTDISGHWAENNIKRAAALGYITGYQDGSFKPNAPITRAEAMTLMNRVLGRDKITAAGLLDNMAKFTDNPTTAWYYVAVQEATNSHDYVIENGVETWTGIIANRDWSALEKEWATGAERGAEVFVAPETEEEQPAAEAETEAAEKPAAEAEGEAEA